MQICYLLETTDLHGGVRVVFDQARALTERGHRVIIGALRGQHDWYPYPIDISYVSDLSQPPDGFDPDVVVGTFWTTIEPALKLQAPVTVHLCQGCEWALPEYGPIRTDIEKAYRHPVPKITVGDWLSEQLWEHFGEATFPVECVGQIVDTDMYRPRNPIRAMLRALRRPPLRVLLVGMYENWVKGIPVALEAVARVRREGLKLQLIRVSPGPLTDQERRITRVDIYYRNISPVKMARFYHQADLLLAPSHSPEGFGLPFAEALASGLPAVATAIPSYLSLDEVRDYAWFVPEGDAEAMARGVKKLLLDVPYRRRLNKRGPSVVRARFNKAVVAQRLESSFERWLIGQ